MSTASVRTVLPLAIVTCTSMLAMPIVIGLEPGTSYHDTVREWCGALFTGAFDFRVSICTIHSYIPVDCSAN